MGNHYETLGLSHKSNGPPLRSDEIRKAYRRTLLRWHPDKLPEGSADDRQDTKKPGRAAPFTVDHITTAYKTLSDPRAKLDYDRELALDREKDKADGAQLHVFHTGLDVVDLDDLDYDESSCTWSKSCRCGMQQGFMVTEEALSNETQSGELVTGCNGCSLWLKVLFAADEDPTKT